MPSIATLSANNKILLSQVSALKNHLNMLIQSDAFCIEKEMDKCLINFNDYTWEPFDGVESPIYIKLNALLASGDGTAADLLMFINLIKPSTAHPLAVWLCTTENIISDDI